MSTSILKKAIDELQKDDFRKDYVLGMLETLYEMQDRPSELPQVDLQLPAVVQPGGDEASILDAKARAALKTVQELSQASQEE